jgi:hypothetical protein
MFDGRSSAMRFSSSRRALERSAPKKNSTPRGSLAARDAASHPTPHSFVLAGPRLVAWVPNPRPDCTLTTRCTHHDSPITSCSGRNGTPWRQRQRRSVPLAFRGRGGMPPLRGGTSGQVRKTCFDLQHSREVMWPLGLSGSHLALLLRKRPYGQPTSLRSRVSP